MIISHVILRVLYCRDRQQASSVPWGCVYPTISRTWWLWGSRLDGQSVSSPFQNICSLKDLSGLGDTQRQSRGLISEPFMDAKVRFLSCNRTQSRAVYGLLTGHNTLRRHQLTGMTDSPLGRSAAEDETSAHTLFECEALASLKTCTFWFLFLGPKEC